MKTRRYNIIAVVLVVMTLLSSCRQELCYDHYPMLNIRFTWEQEWERDYGHHHINAWNTGYYGCYYDELRPGMPEWVNMVSYYEDGTQSDAVMSLDGKNFMVEPGENRSILLYNGDTEYIVLSDVASLNGARASATTRSRSSAALASMYEVYPAARTTNPPDILYSAFVEHVPALNSHEHKEMAVKMQPLVYTYLINYEFEYGIDHVVLARGALGGMAESVYLRTGATSEATTIILFDSEIKAGSCQSKVRSFGIPGFPDIYYGRSVNSTPDRKYTLSLEVMLRNGRTLEFSFDVSDQMKNQPRGGVITVKGIRIEDDQDQVNSGFEVDVTDWDDSSIEENLPIGSQPGAIH